MRHAADSRQTNDIARAFEGVRNTLGFDQMSGIGHAASQLIQIAHESFELLRRILQHGRQQTAIHILRLQAQLLHGGIFHPSLANSSFVCRECGRHKQLLIQKCQGVLICGLWAGLEIVDDRLGSRCLRRRFKVCQCRPGPASQPVQAGGIGRYSLELSELRHLGKIRAPAIQIHQRTGLNGAFDVSHHRFEQLSSMTGLRCGITRSSLHPRHVDGELFAQQGQQIADVHRRCFTRILEGRLRLYTNLN